jgi:hypothetical protein
MNEANWHYDRVVFTNFWAVESEYQDRALQRAARGGALALQSTNNTARLAQLVRASY